MKNNDWRIKRSWEDRENWGHHPELSNSCLLPCNERCEPHQVIWTTADLEGFVTFWTKQYNNVQWTNELFDLKSASWTFFQPFFPLQSPGLQQSCGTRQDQRTSAKHRIFYNIFKGRFRTKPVIHGKSAFMTSLSHSMLKLWRNALALWAQWSLSVWFLSAFILNTVTTSSDSWHDNPFSAEKSSRRKNTGSPELRWSKSFRIHYSKRFLNKLLQTLLAFKAQPLESLRH